MSKVIGIDLGSRTTKILQLEENEIRYREIFDTGHDPLSQVRSTLKRLGLSPIMATGYGRHLLCENFNAQRVTEIRACARGVYHLFPSCRTILDVGGQDCKVIRLNEKGAVIDFEMNDRCAAGTGKFLEVMAQTFEMDIDRFIDTAMSAENYISINSMCTVFAESEVVSLITSGKSRKEIALGLHIAIERRLYSMLKKMQPEDDVYFVGGGAKNDCLHRILKEHLRKEIFRPAEPQFVVALGAALLASENLNQPH